MNDDMKYPLPAHTNGLNEIDLPEFVVDAETFWESGGGDGREYSLLEGAYQYFSNPKNKEKLESVLAGQTIRVPMRDLMPNAKSNTSKVYTFRQVPSKLRPKRFYKDGIIKPVKRVQIFSETNDTA